MKLKNMVIIFVVSTTAIMLWINNARFISENSAAEAAISEIKFYLSVRWIDSRDLETAAVVVTIVPGYPDRLPHSIVDVFGMQDVWEFDWYVKLSDDGISGKIVIPANGMDTVVWGSSSSRGDLGT
ncbi:MAG: hypothetical protein H6923_09545 [Alphaproteobacteria bacterium]|nr:hypothetical protein [Alphaproteobacteria bacterium]